MVCSDEDGALTDANLHRWCQRRQRGYNRSDEEDLGLCRDRENARIILACKGVLVWSSSRLAKRCESLARGRDKLAGILRAVDQPLTTSRIQKSVTHITDGALFLAGFSSLFVLSTASSAYEKIKRRRFRHVQYRTCYSIAYMEVEDMLWQGSEAPNLPGIHVIVIAILW